MIAAVFVILCSSSIFVLFKLFNSYGVNSKKAIIINYVTAVILSVVIKYRFIDFQVLLYARWVIPAVVTGILFVSNFYLMNLCTRHFNLSITAISSKMSVVIPVLLSILILKEPVGIVGVTGFIFALIALYFILKPPASSSALNVRNSPSYKKLWIPLTLFLLSGISDSLMKYSQNTLFSSYDASIVISEQTHHSMFIMTVFISCVVASILFAFVSRENPFKNYRLKEIGGGVSLGIVNFGNGSLLIAALSQIKGVVLFPLINISIVSLSAIIGVCFFKDRLSRINIIGLFIAAIALILIQL